ncbi:MAG TPA: ABC transporter permease subunit [Anaerolineaceae bacterium]
MDQIDLSLPKISPSFPPKKSGQFLETLRGLKRDRFYYLLIILPLLYFLVFRYLPMLGVVIAFQDYDPFLGIEGFWTSPWVGFTHFTNFIKSIFFWRIIGNTLIISGLKLLFGFPAPIILALLLNEVRSTLFKRAVQNISYLPHFLSMVVVAGLVRSMLTVQGGLFNQIVRLFGGDPIAFLTYPEYFRGILVGTTLWQEIGWGAILYLAAMSTINIELYEAAAMDGANKFQQALNITLPGIAYVIAIQLIFSIGGLLNAGFEQILLLYSPGVYGVADIIDTYVYRNGLLGRQYSFAAAVGLFKSLIALLLMVGANRVAKWVGQPGLW